MKTLSRITVSFYLLISSSLSFGQIDIGTASSFVLFTSVGAISNVGASVFNGDVGTNAGDMSGFPPGIVNGQIQQTNPITLLAAADVENAYNYSIGLVCDSVIGTSLGNGQALVSNVYCLTAAAVVNGDLIFDGENNPDAVFVLKIDGALDVNPFSTITLINLANINNVYWQINGALNVGDGAIFNGIALVNGAISFTEGSVFVGNGLSRQGAINTTNLNASLLVDFDLSIELVGFEGSNIQGTNLLTWSTETETNNNYFTLERTTDGVSFIELVRVNGAGTSVSINHYSFQDADFENELNYYRLKQTDYDGHSEVFGLISINNTKSAKKILKVVNLIGQEVDMNESGFRIIYFTDGESIKVCGKYTHIE